MHRSTTLFLRDGPPSIFLIGPVTEDIPQKMWNPYCAKSPNLVKVADSWVSPNTRDLLQFIDYKETCLRFQVQLRTMAGDSKGTSLLGIGRFR